MIAQRFPFEPKTTSFMKPGQFWPIPLSDGTFACGRVLQLLPKETSYARVKFLAGLMDWNSTRPPSAETIAGARCIEQGSCHLATIWNTGEVITGYRDLSLDGVEPWLFRGAVNWNNARVKRGLLEVRAQTPQDDNLPVLSFWGWKVIQLLAEKHFTRSPSAAMH